MRAAVRVHTRAIWLGLGLALGLAPSAGAVSQLYAFAPGSGFTPAGGQEQALSGSSELSFNGFCPAGGTPEDCLLRYRFAALRLVSDGLDLELAPPMPIPGLLEPLPFYDLAVDLPDPPEIDGLLVERTTLPPQFQGEQRFRDLVLRTSAAGAPDNQLVFDPAGPIDLPSGIFLDLELVEIRRLLIFDPAGDHLSTLSRTTLGDVTMVMTVIPEPSTALLLGGGLALLALRASRPARAATR